jgi:Translation machinery associated TMA7
LLAGTNPIHNKKPKKKAVEEDDEDKAFKAKQQAGTCAPLASFELLTKIPQTRRPARKWPRMPERKAP